MNVECGLLLIHTDLTLFINITHLIPAVSDGDNSWNFILFLKNEMGGFRLNTEQLILPLLHKFTNSCIELTSRSSSSSRVTFPDLGSTLKYSLEPFSKVIPYRTWSPSGSVPFRMYTWVPMVKYEINIKSTCFFFFFFWGGEQGQKSEM